MSVRSRYRSFPAILTRSIHPAFLAAAAMVACSATSAMADMTLTPAGIARFGPGGLTTFASGFPVSNIGIGPFGIDYEVGGTVLVTTETGNLYRFANVDGQNAAATTPLQTFGQAHAIGLSHFGASIYMNQAGGLARVVQLNTDGTINRTVAGAIAGPTGLAAHPVSGHLFVSTNLAPFRILDVNPTTGTFTTFAGVAADGLSFSPDGNILYAALEIDHLVGYDVATGATVFDSGLISTVDGVAVGGIDGSALGYGALTGSIFVNTRGGCLVEVNLTTMAQTLIASGGSRGDFVAADPSGSGDLLITQTDRVLRLHGIPSPSTAAILGLGGLLAARRRR